MNKSIKKLITFGLIFAAAGLCPAAEQTNDSNLSVGRDDPFGGGFGEVRQESQPEYGIVQQMLAVKPPLFVQKITLKFLRASNLKIVLDKMLSDYGGIAVDDKTNSLIICDTKDNIEKILAEVKNADKTPKQIMIEVIIIDVQLKDDTEIGVDWDFLSTENKDVFYRQGMVFPDRLTAVSPLEAFSGDGTEFMTLGLGGELSIVNDEIRSVVHLLQEKRNVDILASPRVMVVSGQQAEIKTVQEIPYQERTSTSEGGQLTSTQFKEIGVTLQVKATITEDEKILVDIKPEQNVSTGVSISGVPVVDTRKADTTLLMDDGQVVIIGGLRRKEIKHIREQVPILGDIPILGLLFSNDRKIVENSELLLLLSPHIYKGEPVPDGAMARFNEIKDQPILSLPPESKADTKTKTQDPGPKTGK